MLECHFTVSNSLKPTLGALSPSNEQLQISSTASFCVIMHRRRGLPVASPSLESMELICTLIIKAFSSRQLRQMQLFPVAFSIVNIEEKKTGYGSLNNCGQFSLSMFLTFWSKKTRWSSSQIAPRAFLKEYRPSFPSLRTVIALNILRKILNRPTRTPHLSPFSGKWRQQKHPVSLTNYSRSSKKSILKRRNGSLAKPILNVGSIATSQADDMATIP